MARIKNPGNPEITGNSGIIFDSSSQRSSLTNKLKDSLKLPIVCRESMIIKAFGSDSSDVQICDQLLPRKLRTDYLIFLLIFRPYLSSPIQGQSVQWVKQKSKHSAKPSIDR